MEKSRKLPRHVELYFYCLGLKNVGVCVQSGGYINMFLCGCVCGCVLSLENREDALYFVIFKNIIMLLNYN